jgi:hypothetical protein
MPRAKFAMDYRPIDSLSMSYASHKAIFPGVLSSSRGQIKMGDIEVYQEMICDITKESVNQLSSAHCHINKSGYTARDT